MHARVLPDDYYDVHGYSRDDYPSCGWVIPEGATLTERTYSMFTDTDASNQYEVGVNVQGAHCTCGLYQDVTLRYTESLATTLRELFGDESNTLTL